MKDPNWLAVIPKLKTCDREILEDYLGRVLYLVDLYQRDPYNREAFLDDIIDDMEELLKDV